MKNNLCLFERPFKIQKNGVFLFEISFFVLEILTFLCGLHEVYSHTMVSPDLFIYVFIYLSTRVERLSRGLV